ncbi:unnamed protein product [Lathyrus sativus]|nr:unnamed protein product [Lathyrus sativus]
MASEIPLVERIHFTLTQSFHHKKFSIPNKFVEKYGKGLPKDVYLNTPIGEQWKINLVKRDGKIWFGNGWKEFAEFHSLSYYHLIVFRYESTSHFEVQIFNKTALEINYPLKRIKSEKIFNSEEVVDHTHKKHKEKHANKTLERAKSFKRCNPSFVLVMRASYVESRFQLTIPAKFGKEHFDLDKKRGYIYFQVLDRGLVWCARYSIRKFATQLKFELTRGWKEFSMDNSLKVGDVCNFELILRTKMTFHVHIFRKTNEVGTDLSTSPSKTK